ncbi:ankyrin repeat and MYND domain-containing protein 2 [Eupeodes corollae]|uniref:ankyrin repeat and MYND domain-containing protein 2 n=1 Tax=Eupeodes corollae TaxID=290404 RepID=UPI002493CA4A|nr:ankyrin repeat and MYND domain-containing protein 2 [Eupeodes corollae]
MSENIVISDLQKQIFEKLSKNETNEFKQLITHIKSTVNFVDENGMSPLQHACSKGNIEAVKILLDQGADVNFNQHGANYTSLHFAALSGNKDICNLLLDAGIIPTTLNSVSRTASQMAAFVGNYTCVEAINNYVPKAQIEQFTKIQGNQKEPCLPPQLLDSFHKFVIEVNLHPVRIALNLQRNGNLIKHLPKLKKVLQLMTEKEMHKKCDINELMAFKYHYLRWTISEIMRCEEQCQLRKEKNNDSDGKHDFIELFVKRVLKENKQGQLEYVEFTIRDCVREFPFRECTIFRQVVSQLANKDSPPALFVLRSAINGQRGFIDEISFCSTCGEEKPDKKCSKCKAVQYCDRECQRLHWFMHKKTCARPTSAAVNSNHLSGTAENKHDIDAGEIQETLKNLVVS